jgi:hypothetical protein
VGLWIDVEGAEFGVLEGMSAIRQKVVAVHVETARVPLRQGQRTLRELVALMRSYGFRMAGSNIPQDGEWGDVVFVSERAITVLGLRFAWCKLKAYLGQWIAADRAAVFLKTRWPAGYRMFRHLYLRVGT